MTSSTDSHESASTSSKLRGAAERGAGALDQVRNLGGRISARLRPAPDARRSMLDPDDWSWLWKPGLLGFFAIISIITLAFRLLLLTQSASGGGAALAGG